MRPAISWPRRSPRAPTRPRGSQPTTVPSPALAGFVPLRAPAVCSTPSWSPRSPRRRTAAPPTATGFLVFRRRAAAPTMAGRSRVWSAAAAVRVGSREPSIWTDLSTRVDSPPPAQPDGVVRYSRDGKAWFGIEVAVAGAPWSSGSRCPSRPRSPRRRRSGTHVPLGPGRRADRRAARLGRRPPHHAPLHELTARPKRSRPATIRGACTPNAATKSAGSPTPSTRWRTRCRPATPARRRVRRAHHRAGAGAGRAAGGAGAAGAAREAGDARPARERRRPRAAQPAGRDDQRRLLPRDGAAGRRRRRCASTTASCARRSASPRRSSATCSTSRASSRRGAKRRAGRARRRSARRASTVPRASRCASTSRRACPRVNIDPIQIGQVLFNLLMNAVQAIEDRGGDRHACGAAPARRTWRSTCRTTGPGVPPELRGQDLRAALHDQGPRHRPRPGGVAQPGRSQRRRADARRRAGRRPLHVDHAARRSWSGGMKSILVVDDDRRWCGRCAPSCAVTAGRRPRFSGEEAVEVAAHAALRRGADGREDAGHERRRGVRAIRAAQPRTPVI